MPPVHSPGAVLADDEVAEDAAAPPSSGCDHAEPQSWSERTWHGLVSRPWLLILVLLAVISLPLLVAALALHSTHWFPVLDLAMTEVRVRDVGTAHTPLIGLPGRIGTLAQQGSHPGPLSFYALAPFYRLFGSSAWALEAATAALNVLAIGISLVIAQRRGGYRLLLAVAVVLAFLVRGYGVGTLTEPWNPYLPLLWWVVLMLAVWSILCGDFVMFPVAVFAASFASQTHLPYLGLGLGLGALAVGGAVVLARRTPPKSPARRSLVRWGLVALAVGVIVWSPVVADQLRHDPGNLAQLRDYFQHPPEKPVGFRTGVRLELLHLDISKFAAEQHADTGSLVNAAGDPDGSVVPGLLLLALWGVSVVGAWRMKHSRLLRLDVVIGASLVLAVISMARIFGHLWFYLMLWSWALTAVMLFATAWTAIEVARKKVSADARPRLLKVVAASLGAFVVISSGALAVDARNAKPPAPELSSVLASVMPPTEQALLDHQGTATGKDGRYSVTWTDALYIGSQGYGIVLELERNGFTAGVPSYARVPMTTSRVVETSDATAVIHLATGLFIDQWRAKPGAVEVAYVDPRTPEQQAEFARLRGEAIQMLHDAGLDDIIPNVDANLFGAAIDDRLTSPQNQPIQERLQSMLDLGMPTAIFLAPPGTEN
ncbi:MAG TPA: hypothetical protein VGJ03_06755 [Acidimicrobiales bacterium]